MAIRKCAVMTLCVTLVAFVGLSERGRSDYTQSDFNFTAGSKISAPDKNYACSDQGFCFMQTCQKINPGFAPPGDSTVRVSAIAATYYSWGVCVQIPSAGCSSIDGIKCADLTFYSLPACAGTTFNATIYKNPGCAP